MTATPLTEAFDVLIRSNYDFHSHWKACQDRTHCPRCAELLKAKNETRKKYDQLAYQHMADTAPMATAPLAHTAPKDCTNDDLMFLRKQAD